MTDEDYGNEVDLDSIEDEATLLQLLDETEDFDERKMIRARLREVQQASRAKRDEQMKKREQEREDGIKRRAREAAEQKQRTLAMYDQMAKSSPAGAPKAMDIGIYKNDGSSTIIQPKQDLVEDSIKARFQEAEDRKKRILAAYDSAAKSGPAGSERIVRFDAFKKADVSDYTPPTPIKSCTFGMSGGVPLKGGSNPGTPMTPAPILPGGPQFPLPFDPESHLDPMERAIRARIQAADEQKRRTLAAFDLIARTGGCGPKMVILEEFKDLDGNASAPKQVSARDKFKQMDSAAPKVTPNFRQQPSVNRSASDIKEMLLNWCKSKTREYENVEITNFSSSWADGMAFCALAHHYFPDAFEFKTLEAKNRRHNFDLAFKTLEDKADISPLLDTNDMILMKNKPDWKCVFTYIQSIYRHLRDLD